MSKLAHSHPRGILIECDRCEALFHEDDLNAKASDLCGAPICDECAVEVIEENGQFGLGA